MDLKTFIKKYDFEGSIVLLEGKRTVLEEDKSKLTALGKLLAEKTKHILFRSGNASGSDEYFSEGVCSINPSRLQAIIPYKTHRKKQNQAYNTQSLDELNLAEEDAVVLQSKANKAMNRLVDKYLEGDINRNTMKAAYIIRDTVKAIGTKDIPPATFGIFYDDLNAPLQGGTGHTMSVCTQNNIPIINQTKWMSWID